MESTCSLKLSPLPVLVGAVLYDLGPRLCRDGADLWIDELTDDHVVLAFSSPADAHDRLWMWLCHRLQDLMVGFNSPWVEVRDASAL